MWKLEAFYYNGLNGYRMLERVEVIEIFDDYDEAERAWRCIAFRYVDDAMVWHRLVKIVDEDNE